MKSKDRDAVKTISEAFQALPDDKKVHNCKQCQKRLALFDHTTHNAIQKAAPKKTIQSIDSLGFLLLKRFILCCMFDIQVLQTRNNDYMATLLCCFQKMW